MRKTLILVVLLALGGGSGCVSRVPWPTRAEIDALEYGPEPTAAEIETAARRVMLGRLYDPASAQFQFGKPVKVFTRWRRDGRMRGGWKVEGAMNAKNLFGAYTGFRRVAFIIRDGVVEQEAGSAPGHWVDVK